MYKKAEMVIVILRLLKMNISKYFLASCMAGIIDLIVSCLLYRGARLNYLFSCNAGIVSGFIFQYFYCIKYVFKKGSSVNSVLIFIVTFIFGFILADFTMWIGYNLMHLVFLISKFLSMGIPFFITYFIRRKLLGIKPSEEVLE